MAHRVHLCLYFTRSELRRLGTKKCTGVHGKRHYRLSDLLATIYHGFVYSVRTD